MTPSKSGNRIYNLMSELILAFFDTILKAPEIINILTPELRKIINRKKKKISNCASIEFVDNYGGYGLIQRKQNKKIEKYMIRSVKYCIESETKNGR